MLSTEETLTAMRRDIRPLLETAMESVLTKARVVLEEAEQRCARGLAAVAEERTKGLAEVVEERAKGLAAVDARRAELGREVATMHQHKEAQEGRVELNIGGYRFHTSVQALRRVPHTFFDAYFSGRYAQDVCEDGSIFVDRDGEHYGHILEYMRDGYVSVAEPGAHPSVSLLRALKREFGFYCIELSTEQPVELEEREVVFVMGGDGERGATLSSMERYDVATGQWSAVAAMGTARSDFGACVISGELYVTGGRENGQHPLSSVEKYSPSSDTWSAVAPLPKARKVHAAVAVGSAIYVIGGFLGDVAIASVLKFNSEQGTWREVAAMPGGRSRFAACAIGSAIYVFGGYDEDFGDRDSVFKYDTEADTWSNLASMPIACSSHSASLLDSVVYIVSAGDYNKKVLRFDPASGTWTTLTPSSSMRDGGASFVLGGCLYVAGGRGSNASVERYDVDTDTWTAVANMLKGRCDFGTVTTGYAGLVEEQDLFDSLIAMAAREGV
jgi:N-acetylneuraminic acid mutarotase